MLPLPQSAKIIFQKYIINQSVTNSTWLLFNQVGNGSGFLKNVLSLGVFCGFQVKCWIDQKVPFLTYE